MSVEMSAAVGGLPFFPLEFDKQQRLVDPTQVSALRDHVRDAAVTDLLVVSHGWNNDLAEAFALYQELVGNVASRSRGPWDGRAVAVVGVFWPSKRFTDEELIPGGAASLGGDVPTAALHARLQELRGFFDDPADEAADEILAELEALVPRLETSEDARRDFGAGVLRLLQTGGDAEVEDEVPDGLVDLDGAELLEELARPTDEELAAIGVGPRGGQDEDQGDDEGGIAVEPSGGIAAGPGGLGVGGVASVGDNEAGGAAGGVAAGGAAPLDDAGGAAFLGSAFAGMRAGARNALNLATYWTMKRRAGDTGRRGLAPVLRQLRADADDLRLHLVGHSFGGRLVAAAALGEDDGDPALPVESLTLLQAAFSHNGFGERVHRGRDGYFVEVLRQQRVRGPIVVTHTHNDRANRWAYPMASRLSRDRTANFGTAGDDFGAIGSNGAQRAAIATFDTMLGPDGVYADLGPGQLRNLRADAFISDHGDVKGVEVAHLVVSVVAAT
jgi:hypothetical protein